MLNIKPASSLKRTTYDVEKIRLDFPILTQMVNDKPLCFLDNGASAQKPLVVINSLRHIYEECYANVHRGAYDFSERTTVAYENARKIIAKFINAKNDRQIIFTSSATAAINLVAYSFGRGLLKAGDEVIISAMEHHSNIVPWQMLRDDIGITLKIAPISDDGEFLLDEFKNIISEKTKLVAMTHVSNVLGTVTPIKEIIDITHANGAKILVDGSQAVMHIKLDMQALDADFYIFTGHKIYGPSGIGVLYGKDDILNAMPPFMGGGDMISSVTYEKSTWAEIPAKFEAGTPPIAQAIGLGAAVEYLDKIGIDHIANHENNLLNYATQQLSSVEKLHIIGTAPAKAPVISFTMDDAHPHDIATILDQSAIAVRAGHHCAEPLMNRLNINGTARASFGMYNNKSDVDRLVLSLHKVRQIFS